MTHDIEVILLRLDQIIDPKILLRPVNKQSADYLELLDSIEQTGFWNSISVQPRGDKYEVIDGFWRVTACRELKYEPIPAIVRLGITEKSRLLAAQIRANAVRAETTVIEYAKHLRRIQKASPGITLPEIALMVNKRPQWVSQQLNLLTLDTKTQRLVDRGIVPLMSAYMLAKVPESLRGPLIEQAASMPVAEFKALTAGIIKRFMEQVRQGKLDEHFNDKEFEAQPHLRPLKKVLREIAQKEHAAAVLIANNAESAMDGFLLALKWVCHLDRESIDEQRRIAESKFRGNLRQLYAEREADSDDLDHDF